jgi:hypothetical protein
MRRERRLFGALLLGLLTALLMTATAGVTAATPQAFAAEAFRAQWERTDGLVASGDAAYSWYWGPGPRSAPLLERDESAAGGKRLVVYYDKGRMELPLPLAGARAAEQATFGRLVIEMVTGDIQLGPQRFAGGPAAMLPVAGALDDPLAPTYAVFARMLGAAPEATGQRPGQSLDRGGQLRPRPELAAAHPETAYAAYDAVTGHNIPRVFDAFMQRQGPVQTAQGLRSERIIDPLAVIGRPISEAYWTDLQLEGRVLPVLVQLYERRALTYNPANRAAYQVEMGNAGLHYYLWRYAGDRPRAERREELIAHFEGGDQALNGNYWFSFDDRSVGGASTASNRLVSPGSGNSLRAMRFEYNLATAAPVNFAALALNLGAGDGAVDLRGVSAIGFWARGSGRYELRLNTAYADKPFSTSFAAPADWGWVEIPTGDLRNEDGALSLEQALATATRVEIRPARAPQSGFIDIDDLALIRGTTQPTVVEVGLPALDDFEDGDLLSTIGTEWFTYTDRDDGGSSTAELAVVPGGIGGSAALRFRGSFNNQWGESYLGMGLPLAPDGQTIDLSDYSGIEISVRTDGQPYLLRLGSPLIKDNRQYQMVITAPSEWMTLYIPFKLLRPAGEGQTIKWETARTQIENMIITPVERSDAFQLLIDNVRLVR